MPYTCRPGAISLACDLLKPGWRRSMPHMPYTDRNGWCTGPIQAPLLQQPCTKSAWGAAELSHQFKHDCQQQQQAAAGPEQYCIMDKSSAAHIAPDQEWRQDHVPAKALSDHLLL